MSFKRLIPLALLATVAATGASFAANQPTGYVDHHNAPMKRHMRVRHYERQQAPITQSAPEENLPEGWPRTF